MKNSIKSKSNTGVYIKRNIRAVLIFILILVVIMFSSAIALAESDSKDNHHNNTVKDITIIDNTINSNTEQISSDSTQHLTNIENKTTDSTAINDKKDQKNVVDDTTGSGDAKTAKTVDSNNEDWDFSQGFGNSQDNISKRERGYAVEIINKKPINDDTRNNNVTIKNRTDFITEYIDQNRTENITDKIKENATIYPTTNTSTITNTSNISNSISINRSENKESEVHTGNATATPKNKIITTTTRNNTKISFLDRIREWFTALNVT